MPRTPSTVMSMADNMFSSSTGRGRRLTEEERQRAEHAVKGATGAMAELIELFAEVGAAPHAAEHLRGQLDEMHGMLGEVLRAVRLDEVAEGGNEVLASGLKEVLEDTAGFLEQEGLKVVPQARTAYAQHAGVMRALSAVLGPGTVLVGDRKEFQEDAAGTSDFRSDGTPYPGGTVRVVDAPGAAPSLTGGGRGPVETDSAQAVDLLLQRIAKLAKTPAEERKAGQVTDITWGVVQLEARRAEAHRDRDDALKECAQLREDLAKLQEALKEGTQLREDLAAEREQHKRIERAIAHALIESERDADGLRLQLAALRDELRREGQNHEAARDLSVRVLRWNEDLAALCEKNGATIRLLRAQCRRALAKASTYKAIAKPIGVELAITAAVAAIEGAPLREGGRLP